MKRSNKLSLKTETVRQLSHAEMEGVVGGLISGDCVKGGGSGSINSTDPDRYYFDVNKQVYVLR